MAMDLTLQKVAGHLPFALLQRTLLKMFLCTFSHPCDIVPAAQRFLHKHIRVSKTDHDPAATTYLMMKIHRHGLMGFPSGEEKHTCYRDRLGAVCSHDRRFFVSSCGHLVANSHDPAASGTGYWTSGFHFVSFGTSVQLNCGVGVLFLIFLLDLSRSSSLLHVVCIGWRRRLGMFPCPYAPDLVGCNTEMVPLNSLEHDCPSKYEFPQQISLREKGED